MINCQQNENDATWNLLRDQIARMAGLDRFPRERLAIRELVLALQSCDTIAEATRTVDGYMHHGDGVCPTPPTLRRGIYERQESRTGSPEPLGNESCAKCNGLGFEIQIRATWLRDREGREPIACGRRFDSELDAWEFIRDLQAPDLQYTGDVVSGAKECACRRVAA